MKAKGSCGEKKRKPNSYSYFSLGLKEKEYQQCPRGGLALKLESKHRKIFSTPGERSPPSTDKTKPFLELESETRETQRSGAGKAFQSVSSCGSSSGCHSKALRTSWLKQQKFISSAAEIGSPSSKCRQGSFLLRSLSLVCNWLPSCCILTQLSLLCAVCVFFFFFFKIC